MGQFERTLIIVDEGASVHYVEGCTAPIHSSDSLHSAVVEIIVKVGGSKVTMKYPAIYLMGEQGPPSITWTRGMASRISMSGLSMPSAPTGRSRIGGGERRITVLRNGRPWCSDTVSPGES